MNEEKIAGNKFQRVRRNEAQVRRNLGEYKFSIPKVKQVNWKDFVRETLANQTCRYVRSVAAWNLCENHRDVK